MYSHTEDDNHLLAELRKGSGQAFDSLYRRYYGLLYIHAVQKIEDREVAKDIVQDVFSVIWHRRESLEIHTKFSSYLYRSVRNRVLDYISKLKTEEKFLNSLTSFLERSVESTDSNLREKMLEEEIENALE